MAAASVNVLVPEVVEAPVMPVEPAVPKLRKPVAAEGAALNSTVVPLVIALTVPV